MIEKINFLFVCDINCIIDDCAGLYLGQEDFLWLVSYWAHFIEPG